MPSSNPAAARARGEPSRRTVGFTACAEDADGADGGERALDRYRSLFVIGRGGMGTVEAALEQGAAGFARVVALKRLLPGGAGDARHKEMFLREAHLAALLTHPNVVHAYAFGELAGELFMAMEYVEGEPLSRVLRAAQGDLDAHRGLAPGLVAFVLAEVCEGLHAASRFMWCIATSALTT
jgi:eukaryotic-like serine/threonine-protein kinase